MSLRTVIREGHQYRCRDSCGCFAVRVDEAAELSRRWTAPTELLVPNAESLGYGRPQAERAMWPFAVVVVDVGAEDVLEVAAVEDQQPVEAL